VPRFLARARRHAGQAGFDRPVSHCAVAYHARPGDCLPSACAPRPYPTWVRHRPHGAFDANGHEVLASVAAVGSLSVSPRRWEPDQAQDLASAEVDADASAEFVSGAPMASMRSAAPRRCRRGAAGEAL